MTITELTKEIYDKYHKTWINIDDFMKTKFKHNFCSLVFDTSGFYIDVDYDGIDSRFMTDISLPFSMLYGLLEDFFEDNNIHVYIIPLYFEGLSFVYDIRDINFHKSYKPIYEYKTKTEAKMQAILKACEILEQGLK